MGQLREDLLLYDSLMEDAHKAMRNGRGMNRIDIPNELCKRAKAIREKHSEFSHSEWVRLSLAIAGRLVVKEGE